MRRITAIPALFVLLASNVPAQNRARFADVELVGPIRGVVLHVAGGGETRISGELASGETRLVSVPVPVLASAPNSTPRVSFDDPLTPDGVAGRARLLGWRGGLSPIEHLSPGLRARARPALAETPVHVSRAAVLVLLIALIAVLFLRRRPLAAIVAAGIASAATYPLVRAPGRDSEAAVTLVDGAVGETLWRRLDAALDEVVVPHEVTDFELWTEPADASLTWFAPLSAHEPWRVRSRGARLFLASAREVAPDILTRERNEFGALTVAWLRAGGDWLALAPWPVASPLSEPGEPGSPPGWLASNLPQGVTFLIGRERLETSRRASWVRVSGL